VVEELSRLRYQHIYRLFAYSHFSSGISYVKTYCIRHCFFFCRPSDSLVSEDAEIEPSLTTRLDLINKSKSARSYPHLKNGQAHTRSSCFIVKKCGFSFQFNYAQLLRYEMQTNKEIVHILDERDNSVVWNRFLEEEKSRGETCR
jgi:hypothetical protein